MKVGIVLFPSVHYALKAERLFKRSKLKVKMVPVPREVSSDCGICVQTLDDNLEEIISLLESKNIRTDAAYNITDKRITRFQKDNT